MLKCPVCGWEMQTGDIRRGAFACPGCNERLRMQGPATTGLAMIGSAAVAIIIPYLTGAQGYDFVLEAVIVYFLVLSGAAALGGSLFAKLERDPGADDGTILHLKGPPDPPGNE